MEIVIKDIKELKTIVENMKENEVISVELSNGDSDEREKLAIFTLSPSLTTGSLVSLPINIALFMILPFVIKKGVSALPFLLYYLFLFLFPIIMQTDKPAANKKLIVNMYRLL